MTTLYASVFIAVSDVIASGRWYQRILQCENEHPDHPEYGKLITRDGETLLLLHCWDAEPEVAIDRILVNRDIAPRGHGVLLCFDTDDFEASVGRAREMGCDVIEEVQQLPDRHRAIWLRDPDGYVVQLTSASPGEAIR